MKLCEDCKYYEHDTCIKKKITISNLSKACEVFKNKYQVFKVKKTFLKPTNF